MFYIVYVVFIIIIIISSVILSALLYDMDVFFFFFYKYGFPYFPTHVICVDPSRWLLHDDWNRANCLELIY